MVRRGGVTAVGGRGCVTSVRRGRGAVVRRGRYNDADYSFRHSDGLLSRTTFLVTLHVYNYASVVSKTGTETVVDRAA